MNHEMCWLALAVAMAVALCAAAHAAPSPRVQERFDEGWRFYRGDAPEAFGKDFDDSAWRKVDLPHDWSIEDLPGGAAALPAVSVTPGTWRFKPGDDPAWKDPALDDSSWAEVQLPANWESYGNPNDPAFGWYRRRIAIPEEMKSKDILLVVGKVDDVDETFVNGQKVGGLGSLPPRYRSAWDQPRRYRVPASVLKGDGTDVVAVRVYDSDGPGGLYATATVAAQSGPFDSEAEGGGAVGFTVGGMGWYRKSFTLPEELRGKRIRLTLDGVYMNAKLWVNGQNVGEHPYGYTSFRIDLTPFLQYGGARNVVAVRVDASGKTSRWYPGAGIYRHVWFSATDPMHVHGWGTYITTPEVSAEKATVHVGTTLRYEHTGDGQATVALEVLDAQGKSVATGSADITVPGWTTRVSEQDLSLPTPALWSTDSPTLYRLVTSVSVGGQVVDRVETPFGVRSIHFDAANGFTLNGKPLKLRGGCVHHDNGPLGACTYDRAEERRVELLKASGFNAIRTSHNPPSPAFLDACDRLGVVVIDEAFDCWQKGKNPNDYHLYFDAWWQRDLESMVLRDRNHPSVVLWSIGNEVVEQGSPEGAEIGAKLADTVRSLDPTRPITIGAHPGTNPWENLDPLFSHLGVCGYNYKWDRYVPDHERVPDRVIAGTESFPGQCFESWMATLDQSWVAGDFVWTALDYLGEVALGHTRFDGDANQYGQWPWTTANCGDLDICGFRRPQSYYRDAVWGVGQKVSCFVHPPLPAGKTREIVHGWGWSDVRPSWTWPGQKGQPLTVDAYSACNQVRLTLNGADLGTKDTNRDTRFMATWEVPYAPGELVAVGLDGDGKEVARWALKTAAEAALVRLTPDRAALAADGQDLSYVTVEIADAQGVLNPNADNLVRFAVTGPGRIVAVGSGDPRSTESFQQPQRKAYHGRCLVVIKAGKDTGTVRLTAEADGLKGAETEIKVGG
jgi:beta-galactosidase